MYIIFTIFYCIVHELCSEFPRMTINMTETDIMHEKLDRKTTKQYIDKSTLSP